MGYKDNIVPGEFPGSGAIFMSNIGTKKECFRRQLFGLPLAKANFVLHVKKGMTLFLFEFERRQLYGVFRATSNGEINMEPGAFKSSGKQFSAQVCFTPIWNCNPLAEHEFKDAIRDNYFSRKKFKMGLSKDQVCRLIMLFQSKRIPREHHTRNYWIHGDNPSERDERSGDYRKKSIRDRIGFVTKEDGYDFDLCKFAGDGVKEADDCVLLNGNLKKKVDNFNCDRGGFFTNSVIHNDDFGDGGTRQAMLRRVADTDFLFKGDLNDGHEMHNDLVEKKAITYEDSFSRREKIEDERDIEDSYTQIFTEAHGNHFGKIGVVNSDVEFLMDGIANKTNDFMDDTRIQDEYHFIKGFRQSLLDHDPGSPCDKRSRIVNDGWFFGHETVETEPRTLNDYSLSKPERTTDVWIKPNYDEDYTFGSRTLAEHPTFKPRGTDFGIKFDDDENFAQNPIYEVSEQLRRPFEFSNIEKEYDCGLPYSTSRDTTMITMPRSYDLKAPDILLGPSYIAAEPSSSSKEISTSLSMSKTHSYHSQIKENRGFKTNSREGSQGPFFPEFISLSSTGVETSENVTKGHRLHDFRSIMSPFSAYDNRYHGETRNKYSHRFSSSDTDLHQCEEDPILLNKLCRQRENKHLDGTDKRVSVFDRLTSASEAIRYGQELDADEKHDLDISVNKVMKMLESVVSSPIKQTGSAFKQDDETTTSNKIVDYELPEVKLGSDADVAYDATESGSLLQETRLMDFKRRRKANKSLDDKSKENTAGNTASDYLACTTSDVGSVEVNRLTGMPSKRRKLVRPVFVINESTAEGVNAGHENTPSKDDINSKKAVESLEKVAHENIPPKDNGNLTKAVEGSEKVDTPIELITPPVECQESVNEGEECPQVEGNGNAENHQMVDMFVEGRNWREWRVASLADNQKMCGWVD